MKLLMILILVVTANVSFAKCNILLHESVTNKSHEMMMFGQRVSKILPDAVIRKSIKEPSFGIKQNVIKISTGNTDIFGEVVYQSYYEFKVYQNGKKVEQTELASNLNKAAKQVLWKITALGCK